MNKVRNFFVIMAIVSVINLSAMKRSNDEMIDQNELIAEAQPVMPHSKQSYFEAKRERARIKRERREQERAEKALRDQERREERREQNDERQVNRALFARDEWLNRNT